MTSALAPIVAAYLVVTLVPVLVRMGRGPTTGDRMLAALLTGTTGVAILALLGRATGPVGALDAALVLCLLAAAPVIVFATRMAERERE